MTSPYCSQSNLEDMFGIKNVRMWADLDGTNDTPTITARIAAHIEYAAEDLNDRLRGGPYTIPFDDPPPTTIMRLNAMMAGVMLYENRGVTDYDSENKPIHKLHNQKRQYMATVADLRYNRLRLDIADTPATYPQGIVDVNAPTADDDPWLYPG